MTDCTHEYVDQGEAGNTTGGLYRCLHCGIDPRDEKTGGVPQPAPAPPSEGRQPPIEFEGDWDSVQVEHRQIAYNEQGFRVWLTEAQINKLIDDRRTKRAAPGYERPDVPYFHACEDEPGVLVRRLNGITQRGRMNLAGQWERI